MLSAKTSRLRLRCALGITVSALFLIVPTLGLWQSAFATCGQYCRNLVYECNGTDYDFTIPNGFVYAPCRPRTSFLSTMSDGNANTNFTVDLSEFQAAMTPACGGNGVYQEATFLEYFGFLRFYTVQYLCYQST